MTPILPDSKPCAPRQLSAANIQKLQRQLSLAIAAGNVRHVHKLLAQGASPSMASGEHMSTPLMDAAEKGNPELIELFLPFNDIDATDANGFTALHFFVVALAPLTAPAPDYWRATLRSLCSKAACSTLNFQGLSPLALAAKTSFSTSAPSFSEIFSELSSLSSLSSMSPDKSSACVAALQRPARLGDSAAIALFRADPDKASSCRACHPERGSLAHIAAGEGRIEFLREIAPFADFESRDHRGRTPLMAAAMASRFNVVAHLLAQGCNPQAVDFDGCDALMLGLESNNQFYSLDADKICGWMVDLAKRSDPSIRDILGESALDKLCYLFDPPIMSRVEQAIRESGELSPVLARSPQTPQALRKQQDLFFRFINRPNIVAKFLEQGANPNAREPHTLRTPLMAASICLGAKSLGSVELLAPLADPLLVDSTGMTALHHLLDDAAILTEDSIRALALLATSGPAKIQDLHGRSPLMLMQSGRSPALMSKALGILSPLSDWRSVDAQGATVLSSSIFTPTVKRSLRLSIASAIWENHPDQEWLASSVDRAGNSLAHVAAAIGDDNLLRTLSPQADFGVRNFAGQTPLMAALSLPAGFSHLSDQAFHLLAAWSDCRAVDSNGCDPLMIAIEESGENPALIERAKDLALRCDLAARDFLGESALEKALDRGFSGVAQIIEDQMAVFAERDSLEHASASKAPRSRFSKRI